MKLPAPSLGLTGLLVLALAPAAHAQGFDWNGTYWSCDDSFGNGRGAEGPTGQYFHARNLEGTLSVTSYQTYTPVRAQWRLLTTGWQVTSLSVEVPSQREPSGVHAELFGDGERIAQAVLLDPVGYARGYSSSFEASFYDRDVERLEAHDRWTLVLRTGSGVEILRKQLPVPDKEGRNAIFARYRAAIVAAWKARDEKLLETANLSALGPGPHCLLSTPETRAAIEAASQPDEPLLLPPLRVRRP